MEKALPYCRFQREVLCKAEGENNCAEAFHKEHTCYDSLGKSYDARHTVKAYRFADEHTLADGYLSADEDGQGGKHKHKAHTAYLYHHENHALTEKAPVGKSVHDNKTRNTG